MRGLAIAAILATTSTAHADFPPALSVSLPPTVGLDESMTDYFDGEIRGGWILTGMGVAGLTAGGFLYADGGDRARGASYVAFGMGGVHLAAGIYVNIASRIRKRVNTIAIDKAPEVFAKVESRRMKGVSTQFLILKIVEVGLVTGGATMAFVGNTKGHPRIEGAGYAIAIEAAATLVFDIVASQRAHRYREKLRHHSSVAIDASGAPVLLVGRAIEL